MLALRYPVDDITESHPCELHVKVVNITTKATVGYVLPTTTYHCRPVLDGYVVAGVDEVMAGFEPVKLDHPAGEDGELTELGEAIRTTILWRKEYIVLPGSKPRPPPAHSPPPLIRRLRSLRSLLRVSRLRRLLRVRRLHRLTRLSRLGKRGRVPRQVLQLRRDPQLRRSLLPG